MAETARSRSRSPRGVQAPACLANLGSLIMGLERRPDRRERCEKMLKEQVPWLKNEFFRATDGKIDTIPDTEVSRSWNTSCNSFYGEYEDLFDKSGKLLHSAKEFADPGVMYDFSPGERGCAHSHHRIWQRVAASDKPVLVLEDDVELIYERNCGGMSDGSTFTTKLAAGFEAAEKEGADVLYLGWSGHREGNYRYLKATDEPMSDIIRKAEYVWTTVAYVIWPAGARKLLEKAQPMNQPVDNFMAWEAREGRLKSWVLLDDGDDDETWSGGIVTQFDFNGDSDIKKSDGGDQGDDATEFLAKAGA